MTTLYEHKTQLVGDDYHGLPTTPVKYRDKPSRTGIDWDQIRQSYEANGGVVDDSVWPKVGKVVVITGNARSSRANLHTFTEAQDDEYDEPTQTVTARPRKGDYKRKPYRPNSKLTDAQRAEICRLRASGKTLTFLAREYDVSVTTIVKTVQADAS